MGLQVFPGSINEVVDVSCLFNKSSALCWMIHGPGCGHLFGGKQVALENSNIRPCGLALPWRAMPLFRVMEAMSPQKTSQVATATGLVVAPKISCFHASTGTTWPAVIMQADGIHWNKVKSRVHFVVPKLLVCSQLPVDAS